MRSVVCRVLPFCLLMFAAGCEWDSSGDDGGWSDSYSWINFSGLYLGINGPIVGGFTYASDDSSTDTVGTVVNGEAGGTASAFQTIITGTLANRPGVVPGSVTIVFSATVANGSSGSFTDDGSGGLSGSVNLVGPDPATAQPATGTINYTTGAWTLTLTSPGLLTDATITVSYSYDAGSATTTTDDSGISVAGGQVDTILVEQVGNRLFFTDSNGNTYEGRFNVVSTAGGDSSGSTAGTVVGSFQVNGTPAGQAVTISGTFTGAYTPANSDSSGSSGTGGVETHGRLSSRSIEGIWLQPSGTANVNGTTSDLDVSTTTTTN